MRDGRTRIARCLAALLGVLLVAPLMSCAPNAAQSPSSDNAQSQDATQAGPHTTLMSDFRNADLGCGWQPTGSMELRHARCFTVDYFEGGYALICTADGSRYLVIPPAKEVPEGLSPDIVALRQPLSDVYLAASDTLCLLEALDAQDVVSVSGIERDDWYSERMQQAMDQGRVVYGGKYRTPDYELLLGKGVRLALESTMINHAPTVRDKLKELGIPVFVELSSYEDDPLGRVEWVRLYGTLLNKDEQAVQVLEQQERQVEAIDAQPTGKRMAFFYFNANGTPVVRKPGDYVTKMIQMAGGTYVFDGLEQAAAGSSTTTLTMEQFYATAKDADVLVYNTSIDEEVRSLDDLLRKSELLADFKAVKSGDVWVTEHNMYQQMVESGDIIADLNRALRGTDEGVTHLRRLTATVHAPASAPSRMRLRARSLRESPLAGQSQTRGRER